MEINFKPFFILFVLFSFAFRVTAQFDFKIKSYSISYRILQVEGVGNNPTTVYPLLKHPLPYINFINNFNYNSLWGDPGPQTMHNFYANVELYKNNDATFWKKYQLLTGLYISSKMSKPAGAIANENIYTSLDSIKYSYKYSLTQNQQFFGLHLDLYRKLRLGKKVLLTAGVLAQAGFALLHNYEQRWDSSTRQSTRARQTKTTLLPPMKGKNFFQWQLMLPLGVEYQFYKNVSWVRLEIDPGIVGNRYRYRSFSAREAHAAGVSLIYRFE